MRRARLFKLLSMKTTINQPPEKAAEPQRYPFIGEYINKGDTVLLVLFTTPREGVVLESNAYSRSKGEYCKTWGMDQFQPFKGSITLAN